MTPTASRLATAFTILRGIVYSAGFVLLWSWIASAVRPLDARLPVALPAWLRPIGLALASAGAVLAAACVAAFVTRGRGTPLPLDPPREFVAVGPYRWVRNPMYVGAASVILGAGLYLSSPSIAILAFAFLVFTHLIVILHEEPSLTERFGDSYRDYRHSVSRWWVRRPKADGRPSDETA